MSTLTYGQLQQIWINNGGDKTRAPLAAAIAEAESGGRTAVTSPNPDGGTNVGPWQLDTRGKGAGYSVAQLQDPNTNAAVAVKGSSNGRDWSAWETYVTGAYKPFMSGSVPPDPNVPAAASTTAKTTGADNPASCLIGGGEPGVFGVGAANFCLLDKSQARALVGGLLVTAGFLIALPGLVLLGASAFRKVAPGAAEAVKPLEMVPGYGTAIKTVRTGAENRRARAQGARTEQLGAQRAIGRKQAVAARQQTQRRAAAGQSGRAPGRHRRTP